ncbi:Uncharacterised protein [Streptococcus pneumoniae]|nr:Uncharacterised protein [Streptococcus pneumoniae]CIV96347.1 Uncharacterised protein [Streptococcus pneumoniae]
MCRFVVFFFDGSNEVTSLFFAINTLGMADKARFFDFFLDLAVLFNCPKFHDLIVLKNHLKC